MSLLYSLTHCMCFVYSCVHVNDLGEVESGFIIRDSEVHWIWLLSSFSKDAF